MKIIFVRHGKHEHEAHDGKLLNEGKKQARLLAKRLKKVEIKEIYSSDLKRAKETAEILEKELKISIIITLALREWDSKIIKQDRKKWKKEYKMNFNRLKEFLNDVTKDKNDKENVLIVAHGQLNKLIISLLMKIDPIKIIPFMQDNTCINILEWNEHYKNWRLILMNDTSHLNKNMDKLLKKYRL